MVKYDLGTSHYSHAFPCFFVSHSEILFRYYSPIQQVETRILE